MVQCAVGIESDGATVANFIGHALPLANVSGHCLCILCFIRHVTF